MSCVANLALIPHDENLKKSTETLAEYATRLAAEGDSKSLNRLETWAISPVGECGFPTDGEANLDWYRDFLIRRFDYMKNVLFDILGI